MIEIEGPDGVIYEFPAGTDDNTIRTAMQGVYGGPQATPAEPPMPVATDQTQGPLDGFFASAPQDMVSAANTAVDEGRTAGERAAAFLNRAGESATFGLVGDEAAAGFDDLIGRGEYDERLKLYRDQESNMTGGERLSADLTGAILPALTGAGLIASGGNALSRIGIGSALGGAAGATQGFMEGEGGVDERLSDAGTNGIIGALLGGAIPAVGSGVRAFSRGRASRQLVQDAAANAPTTDQLRDEGTRLYQQVDAAGVQINPQAFDRARADILDALQSRTGYDELPGAGGLTPNAARVMQTMDEASARMAAEPTAALPFSSLDQMRRRAGSAAGNVTNKTDQRAGVEIIQGLDDFVQRLTPGDTAGGDLQSLQSAITKAREVYGRMSRSQVIDDAISAGDEYLSGSSSGIRNQFKNILRNPKRARQFNEAEKMAMRQVINGGPMSRLVNLAGGGLGQLGSIGGGFAAGGPAGAVVGALAATGQRKLSEAMTEKAAEQLRAAIASGGLRSPQATQGLAIAGHRAERLTNSGLLAALLAGQ